MAGGTIALHARTAATTVVIGRAKLVRMRKAAEGRVLGVALRVLDELTPQACVVLFIDLRSDVVITHHVDDVHLDHRQTAECVLAAVAEQSPTAATRAGCTPATPTSP